MTTYTVEQLLEIYHTKKPQAVWHVGREVSPQLFKLRDANGTYAAQTVCQDEPVLLLGQPVVKVDGDEIKLMLRTKDGDVEL